MSEKQPFIQLTGFKGAEFNINGETKSYSIMELFKLKDFLDGLFPKKLIRKMKLDEIEGRR